MFYHFIVWDHLFVCYATVFGMNVGGVPWTNQREPELKEGFRNVMLLCVALLLLVLLCFLFPVLYSHVVAWKRRRDMKRSWSLNRRSFLRRSTGVRERNEKGGYLRLYWDEIGRLICFFLHTFLQHESESILLNNSGLVQFLLSGNICTLQAGHIAACSTLTF